MPSVNLQISQNFKEQIARAAKDRHPRGISAYGFHQKNPEYGVELILAVLEEMELSGELCRCDQLFYKTGEIENGRNGGK